MQCLCPARWMPVLLTVLIALPITLVADLTDVKAAPPDGAQQPPPGAPGGPAGAKPEAKRFPDFTELVKDMKAEEGLFTLYRYDPNDKNRDPEKLLCKVPAGLLNQDLLFATSISRGGFFTGFMWNDALIRWEVSGDQLKLVTPNTNYVQKDDQPVSDAVRRTYNETYLAAVPILSLTPGGDVLFDLGALLKSDVAGVSFIAGGGGFAALGGAPPGMIRPDLSKWTKVKLFPENLLIDVDLAVGGRQGGKMIGVSYAFRRLPALGSYQPRVADDRIGYFLTARVDWSKKATERDNFERYVQRWQLEKRDPSLELSPPKKPIVFIIEKTVPIQWRRWVRQGIEEWNKAFEKVGFVDAVVVHQQTDDNEFANYDPEDARYNFFRWIVSGVPFAMGPSRVDPRTGQILDADIVMDDSFVRAWMEDFDLFAPATVARLKGPGFQLWTQRYPELFEQLKARHLTRPDDPSLELIDAVQQQRQGPGPSACTYAYGMQQQMAFLYNAMLATSSGKKLPDHFIGEAIREVVAHEVGHTLGLRHNFKASSWLSLEEIKRRRDTSDEPTSASVMDYNPLLFFKGDKAESVRHFVTTGIGPYDCWAIEYGYAVPGAKPEPDLLKEIASRGATAGLAYASDEDTLGAFSTDPSSNRYDMGAAPMEWIRARFELCDELCRNLGDWAIQDGESRYYLTRAFNNILFEKARNFEYLGRLVGGQYFHRDHKGDPDQRPVFVPVDPETQRKALALLKQTLFNDAFFRYDPTLLNNLSPHRWWHFGMEPTQRMDYPIHAMITLLQWWTLSDLCSPPVLQRIYDGELKTGDGDRFTAAEFIATLRDTVWSQLEERGGGSYTDAKPMLSSITRGLQREYLDLMLPYLQAAPGTIVSADLDGMIRYAMRELSEKIGGVLKGGARLDFGSRAHLTECKSRIDRALEAQFTAR